MSRAINVDASVADVTQTCEQHGYRISAIEKLASNGTRVVCASSADAMSLRKKLSKKVLNGRVVRSPRYLARHA